MSNPMVIPSLSIPSILWKPVASTTKGSRSRPVRKQQGLPLHYFLSSVAITSLWVAQCSHILGVYKRYILSLLEFGSESSTTSTANRSSHRRRRGFIIQLNHTANQLLPQFEIPSLLLPWYNSWWFGPREGWAYRSTATLCLALFASKEVGNLNQFVAPGNLQLRGISPQRFEPRALANSMHWFDEWRHGCHGSTMGGGRERRSGP